jgi:endonuclease/exonuclease/phosphatase family metal-dependent hydrolase
VGSKAVGAILVALAFSAAAVAPAAALTVMTRNVYLGADLSPVLVAPSVEEMQRSAAVAWAQVQDNDFRRRARALAAEIAAARPDVVGLQEAALFRSDRPADGSDSPAESVVQDSVGTLVRALRARGERYRVAATFTGGDAEIPLGVPAAMDGRITDRMALLVRRGVRVRRAVARRYRAAFSAPVAGTVRRLPRGWIAATLRVNSRDVVVVSTHLESADAQVRTAQARELLATVSRKTSPVVLLGDFNSGPGIDTAAYDALRAGGLGDAWARVHGAAPGLTCCFAADLRTTARPLSSRIDLVLVANGVRPRRVDVVGEAPADRVGGLWPSDHAGVVARLRLPR